MISQAAQEQLAKAALRLCLACASGIGIDDAMEDIHIIYGCPMVNEPQGVIRFRSRDYHLLKELPTEAESK